MLSIEKIGQAGACQVVVLTLGNLDRAILSLAWSRDFAFPAALALFPQSTSLHRNHNFPEIFTRYVQHLP